MSRYFLDTSALLKAYVKEKGSEIMRETLRVTPPQSIYISRVTVVEVPGAMAVKRRRDEQLPKSEREFSEENRREAVNRFLDDVRKDSFVIVELTDPISMEAAELTIRRRLRTYDAMQLASAMAVRAILPDEGMSLTVASSDRGFKTAAKNEGFSVFDPELASD